MTAREQREQDFISIYERLLNREARRIYNTYDLDQRTAVEIVSAAFASCWERMEAMFRHNPEAYAVTAVNHLVTDHFRHRTNYQPRDPGHQDLHMQAAPEVDEGILQDDAAEELLARLSDLERRVIELSAHPDNLSDKEIAQQLGISVPNVASIRLRARGRYSDDPRGRSRRKKGSRRDK